MIENLGLDTIVGPGMRTGLPATLGHHAWPKYFGGKELQELVDMRPWLHDAYHIGLDAVPGLDRKVTAEYLLSLPPEDQARNIERALQFTKGFDEKYAD